MEIVKLLGLIGMCLGHGFKSTIVVLDYTRGEGASGLYITHTNQGNNIYVIPIAIWRESVKNEIYIMKVKPRRPLISYTQVRTVNRGRVQRTSQHMFLFIITHKHLSTS